MFDHFCVPSGYDQQFLPSQIAISSDIASLPRVFGLAVQILFNLLLAIIDLLPVKNHANPVLIVLKKLMPGFHLY
jgi:hypothetical protein